MNKDLRKSTTGTKLNKIKNSDNILAVDNNQINVDNVNIKNKKLNANFIHVLKQKSNKINNKNVFVDWEDSKENPKVFNNKQVKADIQIK
ncbi:MAG: hypothetical protein WAT89_03660 [Candidatus Kapaibacterium sp.]